MTIQQSGNKKIIELLKSEIFYPQVEDIIEITYAYSKKWFNKTLFTEFWWFKESDDYEKIIEWTRIKLLEKIDTLSYAISKCEENDKESIFIRNSCEYARNALLMAYEGIIFEAEKWGYKSNLSKDEKIELLKKIEFYDDKMFWWKAVNNEIEIEKSLEFVSKFYFRLTENEKQIYNEMAQNIEKVSGNEKRIKRYSRIVDEKDRIENEPDFLKNQISQKQYIKIFKTIFNILWINIKIKIDERASIYDWTDTLYFPESYKTLSVKRILALITHEIECHYVNMENWKRIFWELQWANKLPKEEWLAIFMEVMLHWDERSVLRPSFTYLRTLIWEVFVGEELKKYLANIYLHMGQEFNSQTHLRPKRNYPINMPWAQHKDITYARWMDQIVDYLANGNNFYDLFLGRISFEDIAYFKELKEIKEETEKSFEIIEPIFLWEIIKFVLLKWYRIKKDCNHELIQSFGLYLKKKYNFIDRQKQEAKMEILLNNNKKDLINIFKILTQK